MSRSVKDLNPNFRPLAIEFILKLIEEKIAFVIVNTFRTQAEQEEMIRKGVSWVKHSKHQDGLAIDIAPYDIYSLHGENKLQWNIFDPIWNRIGAIGESLGLAWGGRWKVKDMGHFEMGEGKENNVAI